ncbi:WD40-repeat-containing domain protein [Fimicolochytrium jonesii]|uniref:WD40-repeat-containing domain protein n=1 Tax=Fimicolochytrium jonesii TaxID=1396493 RepID=UPI0022FF34ED|nr:WD40-repeat-containing domain protein [Fimicolochytrium jonesii]KAI8815859.1 WD40-repeat-containing domain protein [Fimicolochytrium jonesii]
MKLNYKFSNLCGTVYKKGNLVFTPDGNSVVSPVGNRVSVFDLIGNKSYTLPFENRKDIVRLALSPNGALLITIDEDGKALLINFPRKTVLHDFNFKTPVRDVQFSPNGRFLAVTHDKHVQVWRTPGFTLEFAPFVLHKRYPGHYDDVVHLAWSADSRFFITGSKDMTARIYPVDMVEGFTGAVLTGHRDTVLGAWFSKDMETVYTIGRDGALFEWNMKAEMEGGDEGGDAAAKPNKKRRTDEITRPKIKSWRTTARHYFMQNHAKVVSAAFHAASSLLVVGFTSGIFGIWELPDFTNIHTLSISQKKITSVAINPTGEWLAFGASSLGQLLVWEWQSESYVLKQQGHHHDMSCLSYSQDGQFIATGGDDGKVKLWNAQTGFCFVTFTDHASGINALEFAKQGQIVFSASSDGTIRAFDLIRYRNFRTFTTPTPVQFSCLAVDPSGEVVCAGSSDTFEIFVWSVQTGKLLDIYTGHEGPVSSLAFSPSEGTLASASWDKSVRLWDVFGRDVQQEGFEHQAEVLSIAYRPDGKVLATSTLDGQIIFWNVAQAKQIGSIEGRKDISGGRKSTDRITSANNSADKHFTSICFTADGTGILAGGNSKYVCIYDAPTKVLLKRFQISHNLSMDGMQELLNSRNMTEAGPRDLIDDTGDASDLEDRMDTSLPGVQKGDASLRKTRPIVRTKGVRFSPTGRSWAAASTEGLIVYSLDEQLLFDPFDLEMDITPESITEALTDTQYLRALVMSFRLGERPVTQTVFDAVPADDVTLVARELPVKYLERMLGFLVAYMDVSPRIQFCLMWATSLLRHHGRYLKDRRNEFAGVVRGLQKAMGRMYDELNHV